MLMSHDHSYMIIVFYIKIFIPSPLVYSLYTYVKAKIMNSPLLSHVIQHFYNLKYAFTTSQLEQAGRHNETLTVPCGAMPIPALHINMCSGRFFCLKFSMKFLVDSRDARSSLISSTLTSLPAVCPSSFRC